MSGVKEKLVGRERRKERDKKGEKDKEGEGQERRRKWVSVRIIGGRGIKGTRKNIRVDRR